MILYVVNLLYDNLKKKKDISNNDNLESLIIDDAKYIAEFAGIKKNTSMININNGLMNILNIIKKYEISTADTLDILDIILGSKNNNWIIRRCFEESLDDNKGIVLTNIVNDVIKRDKKGVLDNLERLSDDLRMLILKTIFGKIKEENEKAISMQRFYDVS